MPDTGHKKNQLQEQVTEFRPEKTHRQIDQAEEQFNRLINQLPVGFFRSMPDGQVISANRALLRMAGYESEEEVVAIPAFDFYLDPDNRRQLINQLDREGQVKNLEMQFRRKNGETSWVLLNVFKVLDRNGQFACLEGTAQDITDRKMMEEALKASEARYRLYAENVSDLIWAVDADLKYTYVSPSVEYLTSFRAEEFLGRPLTNFLTPESKALADELTARALARWTRQPSGSARLKPLELEVFRRDGSTFWTECLASVLHDAQGGFLGLTGVTRDITERRRSEEALRESEARYADIAAHIPGVVFQFLRRRDGSYAIPYVSQKVRDIIGVDPERVVTDVSSIFDLIPAADLEGVYAAIEESARTMTDYRVDHRIVRSDGTTVWLRVQGTPHSTPDGEVVWNAVAIDVTDSKAADDRLRAAHAELEQRVRERTADLNRLTSALEVLLEHREIEKRELETKAVDNYNLLVKPYVDRLRNSYLDAEQEELVGLLEKNFNQVFAPLRRKLSSELAALTPTEIQVAHLIRDGKTTKEMSKLLNVSLATVSFHRHNIRAKFGLVGSKQNLRTHLENIIWR